MYASSSSIPRPVLIGWHRRRWTSSVPVPLRWRRGCIVLLRLPMVLLRRVTHRRLPHVWWRRAAAVWRLHHWRCPVLWRSWWRAAAWRSEVTAGTVGDVRRRNVPLRQMVRKRVLSIRGVVDAAAAVEAPPVRFTERRATVGATAAARLLPRLFNVGVIECGPVEADATE